MGSNLNRRIDPYQTVLVRNIRRDWLGCIRSRVWRAQLNKELSSGIDLNLELDGLTGESVIQYISDVYSRKIYPQSDFHVYDKLCWLSARSPFILKIAINLQIFDSLVWFWDEFKPYDIEEFLSVFTEFATLELLNLGSVDSIVWTSANARRNARNRCKERYRLDFRSREEYRHSLDDLHLDMNPRDDYHNLRVSSLKLVQKSSFWGLVSEVSNVSGVSMEMAACAVLFHGHGVRMKDLLEGQSSLSSSQIEYGFRKIQEAYKDI